MKSFLLLPLFLVGCGSVVEPSLLAPIGEIAPISEARPWPQVPLCDEYYVHYRQAKLGLDGEEILLSAIDYWNQAVGFELFISVEGEEKPLAKHPENSIVIIVTEGAPGGFEQALGFTLWLKDIGSCTWQIEISKKGLLSWAIYTHELGHALGFSHALDPLSIMFEKVTRDGRITQGMVDYVRGESE